MAIGKITIETLRMECTFKCISAQGTKLRQVKAGAQVRCYRHPMHPGEYVLEFGRNCFMRLPCSQIKTFVQ